MNNDTGIFVIGTYRCDIIAIQTWLEKTSIIHEWNEEKKAFYIPLYPQHYEDMKNVLKEFFSTSINYKFEDIDKMLQFVNAQEMHRQSPETFFVPSADELASIKVGSKVKVCVEPERFWCEVKSIEGDIITATIDNDLIFSESHGLDYGNEVKFKKDHIYAIWKSVKEANAEGN